jgi:hypothetical protein
VGQEIVLALFLGDLLQSSQKIVTVDKDESTGSVGKLIQNCLIVGTARDRWNDALAIAIWGVRRDDRNHPGSSLNLSFESGGN